MQETVNLVCTALYEGEAWHENSALSCFALGFRGLGRWHAHEACGDEKTRMGFEKYMIDNHKIRPVVDTAVLSRAVGYSFGDRAQLEQHLNVWAAREMKFIADLKSSIALLSASKDYTVYKMLCEYLCEVENELLYINILQENLKYNQYAPHHVSITMMMLHKYFEKEYDGGRIDFCIT